MQNTQLSKIGIFRDNDIVMLASVLPYFQIARGIEID